MAAKKAKSTPKMTDVEIRLACLQAAAETPSAPEEIVALAIDYYRFVTGETEVKSKTFVVEAFALRARANRA